MKLLKTILKYKEDNKMTNNNQNTNTNNKEDNKMTNDNILMNGNGEATNLFEAFVSGGVEVKPILPVGSHKAIWKGLDIDVKTMTFKIKFTVDDKSYDHTLQYTPDKAERILWTFQAIARQFGLEGTIAFQDYNKFIGKEFTVWAVKVEGYAGIFYNYRAPKTVMTATETTISDKTEF